MRNKKRFLTVVPFYIPDDIQVVNRHDVLQEVNTFGQHSIDMGFDGIPQFEQQRSVVCPGSCGNLHKEIHCCYPESLNIISPAFKLVNRRASIA